MTTKEDKAKEQAKTDLVSSGLILLFGTNFEKKCRLQNEILRRRNLLRN